MSRRLTSPTTCKKKKTYASKKTAYNAERRRNKAWGYKYLKHYKCNNCGLWHIASRIEELNTSEGGE